MFISSTEKYLLDFVKTTTGVGKNTTKKTSQPHHAASFTYVVYNRQALSLLKQCVPFLRTYKRARAELVLKNYLDLTPRNGKYTQEILSRKKKFEETLLSLKANNSATQ